MWIFPFWRHQLLHFERRFWQSYCTQIRHSTLLFRLLLNRNPPFWTFLIKPFNVIILPKVFIVAAELLQFCCFLNDPFDFDRVESLVMPRRTLWLLYTLCLISQLSVYQLTLFHDNLCQIFVDRHWLWRLFYRFLVHKRHPYHVIFRRLLSLHIMKLWYVPLCHFKNGLTLPIPLPSQHQHIH